MYSKYKKFVQINKLFRSFDLFLRFLLLIIIRIIEHFYSRKKLNSTEGLVFILHGGFGDLVLLRDVVNALSKEKKTIILLDKNLALFEFIFNIKEIYYFDKNNIFSSLKTIKKRFDFSKLLFVQTSPIFEVHLIKYYLGIRSSVGLKYSFNQILDDANKNHYQFKFLNKEKIYQNIFSLISNKKINHNKSVSKREYIVLSPTKNKVWENVKIPPIKFAELINELIKYSNYEILIFGVIGDKLFNNEIISMVNDISRIKDLTGRIKIQEAVNLISEADLFIGNDNGMAHIAANLGVNTYVIFTFSNPKVYKWPNNNYKFYFNNSHKCMPCVSLPKIPVDNYPVICNYQYRCHNTIDIPTIISELKELKWIGI